MLNQFAVEIPTLPVNQCLSHLIQFLWDAKPFSGNAEPQRWAAKHLRHTWYIGKRFLANPAASSSAPFPQESNPRVSNVSEDTSPHVMSERQTPALDPRCQSGPSARNSVVLGEEDLQRIRVQTNNNDCRFQILIS